ncbi:MAG: dockerin type I domain-containing protein [Candidatus Bathyarchaeota archaeon]|jgi:hypothetical protein
MSIIVMISFGGELRALTGRIVSCILILLLVGVLTLGFRVSSVSAEVFEPSVTVTPESPTVDDEVNVEVSFEFTSMPPYVEEFGPPTRIGNRFYVTATIYVPTPDEFVATVMHDDSFTYQLGNLPAGSYQFDVYAYHVHYMEGTHYLAKRVCFEVTIPGDVNGDRIVDIFDIGEISAHWHPGPPVGPLGFDTSADVNSDGAIDIFDVGIASAHWGES